LYLRQRFTRSKSSPWGWRGIEVWNFLSALGGVSVLRGIFKSIVDGWVWYDQFFLFGGAFLIILGILAFKVKSREIKKQAGTKADDTIREQIKPNTQELPDIYQNINDVIKELRDLENTLNSIYWLQQNLMGDLQKCKIFYDGYNLSFSNCNDTDFYFDLEINFINANVYDLVIIGIKDNDRFRIWGQYGTYPVELKSPPTSIPHGERRGISFRQRVSKEMRNLIIKQSQSKGTIALQLNTCNVLVKRGVKGSEEPISILLGAPLIPSIEPNVKEQLSSYTLD
jgi:hypothetical protein